MKPSSKGPSGETKRILLTNRFARIIGMEDATREMHVNSAIQTNALIIADKVRMAATVVLPIANYYILFFAGVP